MSSATLATLAAGRNNNFNLLRFVAASVVVLTHAYGLTGHGDAEPLLRLAGLSMGSYAVDLFFIASGFLITKSWLSRNDLLGFFLARALRIYPALWVSVLACGLILGPLFTRMPLNEYFFHLDTFKFFGENGTLLIAGVFKTLPGVFSGMPSSDINQPLWTLPYELKMYFGLAALGLLGILRRRALVALLVAAAFIGFCATWTHLVDASQRTTETLRFIYFFFSGSALYLFRDRLSIGWAHFAAGIFLAILAPAMFDNPSDRRLVLALLCPPLVIMAAFLPQGRIRLFNQVGDYSYGIYIFGMPIQQSLIALTGTASVFANFTGTYFLTLLLAIASWHLLEKKALACLLPRMPRKNYGLS